MVPVGERIVDGQRNDTLFRYACGLRGKGGTRDNILASIKLLNAQQCVPPLADDELQDIARSAARYESNHAT
jgi:hypothetical protein